MRKREQRPISVPLRIFLILLVFLILITPIIILGTRKTLDTSDAYGFNLFMARGEERTYNEVRKTTDVRVISEAISGKYKRVGYKGSLSDIKRDYTFIIIPTYPDYIGNPDDNYYRFYYGIYDEEDSLLTSLGIYVLSDRKIAMWDEKKGKFWIGKKTGEPLDLKYLESMLYVMSGKPFKRAY